MALMYLHLRPSQREDQPFDDMDDDSIIMGINADSAALITPPDSGTLEDTIMDAYDRLGLA